MNHTLPVMVTVNVSSDPPPPPLICAEERDDKKQIYRLCHMEESTIFLEAE